MAAGHLNKPHVWYVTELGEADHGFDFFCPFQKVIDDIVQSSDKVFACSQFIVDSLFPDHEKLGVEVLYNNIRIPEFGSTGASFLKLLAPCELAFLLSYSRKRNRRHRSCGNRIDPTRRQP